MGEEMAQDEVPEQPQRPQVVRPLHSSSLVVLVMVHTTQSLPSRVVIVPLYSTVSWG